MAVTILTGQGVSGFFFISLFMRKIFAKDILLSYRIYYSGQFILISSAIELADEPLSWRQPKRWKLSVGRKAELFQ